VEPNTLPQERTTVITFVAGDITKEFTLTQRAAGTESDDWKKDQFVHRSLAMRFTATWCGYCPMLGSAFESAKTQMNGSLELVSLHGSDSNYEFSGTNTLVSRFRVQGFPTGVVDARAIINNNEQSITSKAAIDLATETAESYPVTTGIACSSTLSGNTIDVDLELYVKEADTYRVTVLLLEDNITGYQNDGGRSDNNYVHNDVARLAITSMNGEKIEVSGDNQIVTKSFSGTIKSSWDTDNLKLLIYVEKPYGDREPVKGVDNQAVVYGSYGDTYIDNCRAVKVGETAALELR
jgi:thiol-disulfide isomerase/thioredoxin